MPQASYRLSGDQVWLLSNTLMREDNPIKPVTLSKRPDPFLGTLFHQVRMTCDVVEVGLKKRAEEGFKLHGGKQETVVFYRRHRICG